MVLINQRSALLIYSQKDSAAWADAVAELISSHGGYRVERDHTLLAPDDIATVARRLQNAEAVIVLLSAAAEQNPFVEQEFIPALRGKKCLVAVLLHQQGRRSALMSLVGDRDPIEAFDLSPHQVARLVVEKLADVDPLFSVQTNLASPPRFTKLSLGIGAFILIGLILYSFVYKPANLSVEREKISEREAAAVLKEQQAQQMAARAEALEKETTRRNEAQRLTLDGQENAKRGRLTQAIKLYEKSLELDPKNLTTLGFMGYAHLRRSQLKPGEHPEDVAKAISFLEKCIELDPNDTWGYYNLSLAHQEAGNRRKAIENLQSLFDIDPSFKDTVRDDMQFRRFQSYPEFKQLLGASSAVQP